MIEVHDLVKRYGNHTAVDHLNFRVEQGQIYGFLGPNGAGKSTTMNMLTGYLAATEGTILINGHDITEEPQEAKRCIGYLPELPPLYQEMTSREYLQFAAELKRVPKAQQEEMLHQAMEQTQILDVKDRLIRHLSKGYRQRVGLAQALIGNPEVLILDEPMVGLDPKQIIEIRELIRSLGKKHTIILSSHILSEIASICDHIMIISHGRLVASDSPEGLQNQMRGTSELSLLWKGGSFEEMKQVLQGIESIEKIEPAGSTEPCLNHGIITIAQQQDAREEIFYKMAEAHMPIMGMQLITKSLEDIFLELTGDEKKEEDKNVGNL